MALALRPFVPSDARFVRSLSAEVFAEYSGLEAGPQTLAVASSPGARTLVAAEGDRRVGFSVVTLVAPGVAHLAAIALVEWYRGRGLGLRLVLAAERCALALGARRMELVTGEANL